MYLILGRGSSVQGCVCAFLSISFSVDPQALGVYYMSSYSCFSHVTPGCDGKITEKKNPK